MANASHRIMSRNTITPDDLIPNLIAFNVGVEIGQLLALSAIIILTGYCRRTGSF